MDHCPRQLAEHIIRRSEAKTFALARLEWSLTYVYEDEGHCPCGVRIKDHCVITNRLTGRQTFVGNVCVEKFLGIETDKAMKSLKKIKKDQTQAASSHLITLAFSAGVLNDWERTFMGDTSTLKTLTQRQMDCRQRINRKIIEAEKKYIKPRPGH